MVVNRFNFWDKLIKQIHYDKYIPFYAEKYITSFGLQQWNFYLGELGHEHKRKSQFTLDVRRF